MRILITGHRGFIGKNMLNALVDDHDIAVYEPGNDLPNLEGFDWCIHLGARSSTTETNVEMVLEYNYDFSRWLLAECQKHNVNFQYASSASVYGLGTNFSEDDPVQPMNPYAWSKVLFERYANKMRWTIRVQGFRYFNVFGPLEGHKGKQASPYEQFAVQAQETGVIKLFENSDKYLRDFVHVDRVVDVHKKFFDVDASGVWNIGSGSPKSFEQVAKEMAEKFNARIEYIPMPDNLKNQYQAYTCADLTNLRKHYAI